jgi:catechol 2,3-dioxygenase-like lactoylglutathione lyase family enzyme
MQMTIAMTLPIDAHITFLKVADLDRSSAFYGDGLGLTLVLDQGGCRIYSLTDSAFLGVCERPGEHASNVMVTFVSDDVAGWHERFVAAGADVDGPPRDNNDYRIFHFFATDPDGHTLEVQRFWDEDWDQPA